MAAFVMRFPSFVNGALRRGALAMTPWRRGALCDTWAMATENAYREARLGSARLSEAAGRVLTALEAAGFEAWIVGGWVRDALLGAWPGDVDVATSAPWQESEAALVAAGLRVRETGAAHGTVTAILHHEGVETTTYRVDGPYADGRHPSCVAFVGSVELDLARRDFTVNAMAWHPARGLFDPFGGLADLEARLIRAVGDPGERFEEDGLRVLRAVRFAARLGFEIEGGTQDAVRELAPLLARVSSERIGTELRGILMAGRGGWPLREEREAMFAAIPELAPMEGFAQHSRYHSMDVLSHVCRVMDYVEVYTGGVASEELRWCALLHDIGKPFTLQIDEAGQGHFYGHPAKGMEMADAIMRRLALPHALRERTVALVRLHDRPVQPTRASVLSILADLDELCPGEAPRLVRELMVIKRADAMAKAPAYRDYALEVDELDAMACRLLAAGEPYRVRDLEISGTDLLERTGRKAGPWLGEVLRRLLREAMAGAIPNERGALGRRGAAIARDLMA